LSLPINAAEDPSPLRDLRLLAYAKVNLCLYVGERREDGRHELVTLFESVDLADELLITPSASGTDEVVCPRVPGPNLVQSALAGLRELGWAAPPVRVEIDKRIPIAAGMGGGSADAAALLRHAPDLAPVKADALAALAARLGSDVPSQLDPGPAIGTGAGDLIRLLPDAGEHALLVIPQPFGLSTADVYRAFHERDRIRSRTELLAVDVALETTLVGTGWVLPPALTVNELQAAALTLRPEINRALTAARLVGAERAIVCGSGPTVIGLFWGQDAWTRAAAAAAEVAEVFPGAVAARPQHRGVGGPTPNG
jgi:4-diphosphocytidyl-2-C-methyl-D-erythritol kinase